MNHTAVLRTPLDAAAFTSRGCRRLPFAQGVFRAEGRGAVIASPVLEAPGPFEDLVGSWNADLPPGARLKMEVQARLARTWSAWYVLAAAVGQAGRRLKMSSPDPQEDADGAVAQDTLRLKSPATALRYRLRMDAPVRPAILRQAAITVSDATSAQEPAPFYPGPWVRRLKVTGRSQMVEPGTCKRDICSPTSLAAVLEYWGVRRTTLDMAGRVRDQSTGNFGNWTFNIAAAGALGLAALAARLDSLDDLAAEIAAGRPVVVSISFGPGELAGAPIKQTSGHLIVVTGFTPQGDVVVMDPAGRTAARTRRIYRRGQFHRAWRVNKRGLAYLLGPRLRGRRLLVGVPVADLWSSPGRRRSSLPAPDRKSQLIYGEKVTVLDAKGDWVKISADEQAHRVRDRRWRGYPGWVKAAELSGALPLSPNCVVRTRQALLKRNTGLFTLSVGTRLQRLAQTGSSARVRLLNGGAAELPADSLTHSLAPLGYACRPLILHTAELFLGTSYYWGGRSGVQPKHHLGVDCSGLVSLAYRVCGMDLPRDAHEQRLRSRPVSRRRLKPGDLVFLTASAGAGLVTHVMIYAGSDGLIESRQGAGRALRCTFAERFGVALKFIKPGQIVTDLAFAPPRRRRIFFGSYF